MAPEHGETDLPGFASASDLTHFALPVDILASLSQAPPVEPPSA